MLPADDVCYAALTARDARFDGRFFVGVVTTGIYCRPVCPARTPQRRNVRFFGSAAAAAAAGLRACRRCRPDTMPGSREWDHRSDLVARALRSIAQGADSASTVAADLHVGERHLNRLLVAEVGVTAGQLLRTRRAQTARMLLEQTVMPAGEIALIAGFGSVRQFNEVVRQQFGATPGQLRGRTPEHDSHQGTLTLRLRMRPPYAEASMLAWFARHAVPGVDTVDLAARRITTMTPDGVEVRVQFAEAAVQVALALPETMDMRAVPGRIAALRRWLDLDSTPAAIDASLSRIPALADLVRVRPGLRVPGALDTFRSLTSTIVSQQVSVAAAATQSARLCSFAADGTRFPTAGELAACDADDLARSLGVPRRRGRTLVDAAAGVASGEIDLDPAGDHEATVAALGRISGVGPWTSADVRMRCLADPDVWPAGDLILKRAVGPGGRFADLDPTTVAPWRSYLAHHVWIDHAESRREAA